MCDRPMKGKNLEKLQIQSRGGGGADLISKQKADESGWYDMQYRPCLSTSCLSSMVGTVVGLSQLRLGGLSSPAITRLLQCTEVKRRTQPA